jgi:MFS transporter, FHS family, Na+ dependent glucose transporter 1
METSSTLAPAQIPAVTHRSRMQKTLAYYAAFIILGLATASFGPTLPGLAAHVRSSIGQISYLFILRSLGYLIGSMLGGRLYDRMKGHPLMVGVIVLMAAAMIAVPLVPMLWLLGVVLLVLGIAEGVLDVGGNTLLVWVHREKMGPYMNGLHFFFGFGAFLSPIIIAQTVLLSGDIYWAYWALAGLMLPVAFWLARLPSPEPIVATEHEPTRPAVPLLIALLALFAFFYVSAEVAFGGWVFTYAVALKLSSETVAAYLTAGFWGSLTAGRLASIPIAMRFQPRTVLIVDILIVLASLLLILALPGSFTALWAGAIGAGLGMASIFPTMLALAERHMTMTGSVTSWFFVGSSLGAMTLPWIIGQLFESIGPQVTMISITMYVVICLLLLFIISAYASKLTTRRK